jgi:hypothetical protein
MGKYDEISFAEWWRKVLKKVHKSKRKGFNSLVILGWGACGFFETNIFLME